MSTNLQTVRRYLEMLEAGRYGDELAQYFTDDARQIEYPNRLNPNGGESDVPTLIERSKQGAALLTQQRYEVVNEMAQGDRVAVEAVWTAQLAVGLGTLQAGATMRARFAMFFELRDGRIVRQRNYDCFDAW